MSIYDLFNEHGVTYVDHGEHGRTTAGWLNIHCPFNCGESQDFHMGYCLDGGFFRCWRCGWHPHDTVFATLLKCPRTRVSSILREFEVKTYTVAKVKGERVKNVKPPSGIGDMTFAHRQYLHGRGLDPDEIETRWQVSGIGQWGWNPWSLYIPVYVNGKLVSYQTRAIGNTGNANRYRTCPDSKAAANIRNVLYGQDQALSESVVVVEGVFDVWKLGPGAVATFGIDFSHAQANMIRHRWKAATIIYDPEPGARRKACELRSLLQMLGVRARIEVTRVDPGDMEKSEAMDLMKRCLR